jgi:hypothetical protein
MRVMSPVPLACATLVAAEMTAQLPDRQRRIAYVHELQGEPSPVLDGVLDDPCWQAANPIGELTMVEPYEGKAPTQRTIVRIVHDRENLYFGIHCLDDDPSTIRATQRQRDARLDPDDRVEILLDPFENRRTGYFFQIGAGGSIGDGLSAANGSRFDKPWDVIFDGRSRITSDGWQAEVVIPFRSIPRKAGAASWGFNLKRYKRSAGEEYQWDHAVQSVPFFRISELGTLTGFGAIDNGIGLDVVPYVSGGMRRDRSAVDDDWNFDPDAGVDFFYRLTPELELAATSFTDFAETENDERQINLNRFPLFFPEKRDFFLQGAGYFAFGPRGNDVLPFFSRRIGLDGNGGQVPLLAGLKLTGEVGPLGIGLLNVETDARGAVSEPKNLGVARFRYSLAEQTAVGLIATNGHPTLDLQSQTFGVDLYHRESEFVGDLDLQVFASAIGTQTSGSGGDGEDYALRLESQGREWNLQGNARVTSPDFDPALGFVRRPGVRNYRFEVGYKPRLRHPVWRQLEFAGTVRLIEGYDGGKQEIEYDLDWFGVRSIDGDSLELSSERLFERVDRSFDLFNQTTAIAAGDYWSYRHRLSLRTSDGRPADVRSSVTYGDFFDGSYTRLSNDLAWRSSALLHLGLGHESAIVDLGPGRSFTTQIGQANVDLHFSPRLSLYNLVQFDNESSLLGFQARLRWIPEPGTDLFVVLGTGWQREIDHSLVPTDQSLVFKLLHTLRF